MSGVVLSRNANKPRRRLKSRVKGNSGEPRSYLDTTFEAILVVSRSTVPEWTHKA